MWVALIVALCGCAPKREAFETPSAPRRPTLEQLDAYYLERSGGFIRPAHPRPEVVPRRFHRSANLSETGAPAFRAVGAYGDDRLQALYAVDLPVLLHATGGRDLLDAKVAFYSRLRFDPATQLHERPYVYLAAWGTLFHPPIRRLVAPIEHYVAAFEPVDRTGIDAAFYDVAFQTSLDSATNSELTFGNDVTLLANGEGWQEKMRFAREAEHFLFAAVMAITCDETGTALVDELIRRKREGVDVRLILEGFYGTTLTRGCVGKLRDAGIPVLLVSDQLRPGAFTAFMHHKFWIVDGREAIVGGQNIHDYENRSSGFNYRHRDQDLLVRSGPMVTDLLRAFAHLWDTYGERRHGRMSDYALWAGQRAAAERDAGVRGAAVYGAWLSNPRTRLHGACRVVVQEPGEPQIARLITAYIERSRHLIVMTSPVYRYRNDAHRPIDELVRALRARAEAGVPVELVGNGVEGGRGEADMWLRDRMEAARAAGKPAMASVYEWLYRFDSRAGARSNRRALLDLQRTPGIRGWTYFNYMHAKQALFDRVAVSVGSFNIDAPSGMKNHEATVLCLDASLADEMEAQLALDLANAVPVVSRNGE